MPEGLWGCRATEPTPADLSQCAALQQRCQMFGSVKNQQCSKKRPSARLCGSISQDVGGSCSSCPPAAML